VHVNEPVPGRVVPEVLLGPEPRAHGGHGPGEPEMEEPAADAKQIVAPAKSADTQKEKRHDPKRDREVDDHRMGVRRVMEAGKQPAHGGPRNPEEQAHVGIDTALGASNRRARATRCDPHGFWIFRSKMV